MGCAGERPFRILVLCTGNSARSQMAEGIVRALGGDSVEVYSAGIAPAGLHPLAVEAMAEVGIDISGQRSKSVAEFQGQQFDLVLTVCDSARESCPIFPGSPEYVHWSLPDPAATSGDHSTRLQAFRVIRDRLTDLLTALLRSRDLAAGT